MALFKDPIFNKIVYPNEIIDEVIPYCRTCNLKLKTTGGKNSHKKLGHEVHSMKIQRPNPSLKYGHMIMAKGQRNPYELIQTINYSEGSVT